MVETAVILATSSPHHRTHLTRQMPRALLPALGKPIVIRVMDQLYRSGIRKYHVVLGMDEGGVAAYLNKQWMPDAKIEFVLQSANDSVPALLTRIAQKIDHDFVITSYNSCVHGDHIPKLLKQHDRDPNTLTITGALQSLSQNEQKYYTLLDGDIVQLSQETINGDAYLLTDHVVCGEPFRQYLAGLERKVASSMGRNLLDVVAHYAHIDDANLTICPAEWILRLSDDRDLLILHKQLLDDLNDAHILSELPYTVRIVPPVRIDPQVSVGQGAVIGPHVFVERGSSIGYGATVKNAIILERGTVSANANVDGSIITTRGTVDIS